MRSWFYTRLFLWSGTKIWNAIHIYAPDGDDEPPRGITFSNDENYIDKVSEVELTTTHNADKGKQDGE